MDYNSETGDYLNTRENIAEMFDYLNVNYELLESHQLGFIQSLWEQFAARGTLSPKQFRWLSLYYTEVAKDLAGYDISRR